MGGVRGALHERTAAALGELRRAGGKAIVLLNRRGWSNFLSCRSCAKVWGCPECDVSLVLHRAEGVITCHHCGHREAVPAACDACGSRSVARHGLGTERLEHELVTALGGERVPDLPPGRRRRRRQRDARRRCSGASSAPRRACSSAPRWWPRGTTSTASGLGVVLDADATLRFPDFRAEERTFALVAQLAGRAGRGGSSGRVLVQTLAPEAREHPRRRAPRQRGLPRGRAAAAARRCATRPYGELIRIVCSSAREGVALEAARELRRRLERPRRRDPRSGAAVSPARAANARRSSSRRPTGAPPSRRWERRWRGRLHPRGVGQRRRRPAVGSARRTTRRTTETYG